MAKLPLGTQRELFDPFAEKGRPWKLWLFLLALVGIAFGWWQGKLDQYVPSQLRSTTVLGTNAPAYKPPVPAVNPGVTNAPVVTQPAK